MGNSEKFSPVVSVGLLLAIGSSPLFASFCCGSAIPPKLGKSSPACWSRSKLATEVMLINRRRDREFKARDIIFQMRSKHTTTVVPPGYQESLSGASDTEEYITLAVGGEPR